MNNENSRGGFTLPGESGYEDFTLYLADKWGADVIRDSDGTVLSDEIISSGYGIYSTICIIRDHNEWARNNQDKLQNCILMSEPRTAFPGEKLVIDLLDGYFREQFRVNDSKDAMKYYQVIDRTEDRVLGRDEWIYSEDDHTVTVSGPEDYHIYTVNFFAWRIWEEISMYNHVTNGWQKEHLMQIDPIYEETREYMKKWLVKWCEDHQYTTVVRFTSMFYNFTWIWGDDADNRNLYSDWGSYDFSVSPRILDLFKERYGYELCAEDFINGGKRHVTHMPPTKKQLEYMELVNDVVISFGKELVDIVHSYGKKAYVFYDDSWIGVEPTNERFSEFGFDGLIKCVFSGFEARLCSSVPGVTHEIRLHPYLFPVGLGGLPTFSEGGDPTADAKKYWRQVRRGILRDKIDRIGLGGYIHLMQDYPDFVEYIADISNEFRHIRDLHEGGKPEKLPVRVCVLHAWGSLRRWILSGHFHETYMHDLIHINEALAGFPVDVEFIGFEDVKNKDLSEYDVMINAGIRGTAWSGGDNWKDACVVEKIRKWVYEGGCFIGVDEPSALNTNDGFSVFALSDVLGVDLDIPARVSHGKRTVHAADKRGLIPEGAFVPQNGTVYLVSDSAEVLSETEGLPTFVINDYNKGKGIYLSGFETNPANNRMLMNIILYACGMDHNEPELMSDNAAIEFAFFDKMNEAVLVNNSDETQNAVITIKGQKYSVTDIKKDATVFFKTGEK